METYLMIEIECYLLSPVVKLPKLELPHFTEIRLFQRTGRLI